MWEAGAPEQARAVLAGLVSRTAAAAIGLEAFAAGDREAVIREHRRLARRQMTWMRKMPEIELVDVGDGDPGAAAVRVRAMLDH
jgi:tRNA dimethylallyltransferase